MRLFLAIVLSLLGCVFIANAVDTKKLVDMTYDFASDTLHWPTAKPFQLDKVSEGRTPQGFWYSAYNYSGAEHVGTHLDAPFHFAEGRWTTEQIPLAQMIGPGVVLDVRREAEADRDYLLKVSDIQSWEKRYGKLPKGAIVLMYSGWGKYWVIANATLVRTSRETFVIFIILASLRRPRNFWLSSAV
jgi:kynurenine formamidase